MATKREAEKIGMMEEKINNIDDKITEHIRKQDVFEEKMLGRLEELNFILRVFKWIGYGITIASSAIIIWFITTFLNRIK